MLAIVLYSDFCVIENWCLQCLLPFYKLISLSVIKLEFNIILHNIFKFARAQYYSLMRLGSTRGTSGSPVFIETLVVSGSPPPHQVQISLTQNFPLSILEKSLLIIGKKLYLTTYQGGHPPPQYGNLAVLLKFWLSSHII